MAYYTKSSAKTEKVLSFIKLFTLEKGYPPTVREIVSAPECGIKSTASAKSYIDRLVDEGKLVKTGNKNRALEIVGFSVSNKEENEELFATKVPFLGNTAAGAPIGAAVENDRSYALPNDYFNLKSDNFLLQVKGNSMINCGILDGDIVLVKSQNTANNGQIVVAQIDREDVTMKRYYNCGSYIKLKPENDNMEDIIVTPDKFFRILGIPTGLLRNHLR